MPTFHLVVDEEVPAWRFQYRVRMWRQAEYPPIVLSTQVPGHPPPDWYSSLLANLVLRSFLGYALPIPVFFELSVLDEKIRAFRVRFETIGNDLRPILRNPKSRPRLGGHWTTSRITFLVQQGLRLMAEIDGGAKELLANVDEEEDYENLVQLEDDNDE
jgi:hypothetical protein